MKGDLPDNELEFPVLRRSGGYLSDPKDIKGEADAIEREFLDTPTSKAKLRIKQKVNKGSVMAFPLCNAAGDSKRGNALTHTSLCWSLAKA